MRGARYARNPYLAPARSGIHFPKSVGTKRACIHGYWPTACISLAGSLARIPPLEHGFVKMTCEIRVIASPQSAQEY